MIVLDHHFAPLVKAYKELSENHPTLLAKTYFVCDYSNTVAAGTLAKLFFDGMVSYTDLGEKIVQVAQAIDLFQKPEKSRFVKAMQDAMVGYFQKRGFESCQPCDVMKLFHTTCACLKEGEDVADNMPQMTSDVFEKKEILLQTEHLVVYWIPCNAAYDKEKIQKLMDKEGTKYGSAAVLFVTNHEEPSGLGVASMGFRVAQAGGGFASWSKKVLEQVVSLVFV